MDVKRATLASSGPSRSPKRMRRTLTLTLADLSLYLHVDEAR